MVSDCDYFRKDSILNNLENDAKWLTVERLSKFSFILIHSKKLAIIIHMEN